MNTRITTSPRAWARALGMVAVPMFGPERTAEPGEDHAILLDGRKASLALTVGEADRLLSLPDPLDWAWSSNLIYSVILDRDGKSVFTRRWDRPGEVRRWDTPPESEVGQFLAEVSRDAEPTAETVIGKLLRVFWTLRTNIEQRNGSATDLIRSFHTLLVWADAIRRSLVEPSETGGVVALREIIPILHRKGLIDFGVNKFTNDAVRSFAAGAMLEEIQSRDPGTNVALDPDLFIRHAAGVLYEAAHIQLAERPLAPRIERQGVLFADDFSLNATPPRGEPGRDVHFTPPSLARLLVQEAIRAMKSVGPLPNPIEIVDPACGSGVFLVEAVREATTDTESQLVLRGFDRSPVSCIMTKFCLSRPDTRADRARPRVRVRERDSLGPESWRRPDLILMTPPFIAWGDMSEVDQWNVRAVLGHRLFGRPDTAIAFVAKAIDSLRPGAALATVVPASFLESSAAFRLRAEIASNPSLSIRLIGRFRNFNYFVGAAVEPAFLVIVKSARSVGETSLSIRILIAEADREDDAIRALRRLGDSSEATGDGWEIWNEDARSLQPKDWMPRPRRVSDYFRKLERSGIPRIESLFLPFRVLKGCLT